MCKLTKTAFLLITLALTLSGCTSTKTAIQGTSYSKAGLEFICPNNWEITDDRKILNNEYVVNCERQGENESGLLIIKWTETKIAEQAMLQNIMNFLTNNYKERYSEDIKFGDINNKKQQVDFNVTIQDMPFQGWILAKECPNISAGIVYQSAKIDHYKYKDDVAGFINSLSCQQE